MKRTIAYVSTIVVSVGAGLYSGWLLAKRKYSKLADKEVESVKKRFESYFSIGVDKTDPNTDNTSVTVVKDKKTKKVVETSKELISDTKSESQYVNYAKQYQTEASEGRVVGRPESDRKKDIKRRLYVITPEEYHESTYETQTVFHFADGFVADEEYNLLKDVKGNIGDDYILHFGEFEDDCVYIRNEDLLIDFEILKDERRYSSIRPVPNIEETDD